MKLKFIYGIYIIYIYIFKALCNSPIYEPWFIVLLIVMGTTLCIKGICDYRKIRRIEKLVDSDPERYLLHNS